MRILTPEQIAVQFENHEQEIKSLKHRMDNCEKQQDLLHKLVKSVDKLGINMDYMAKEQNEQGERLANLEHEPAEEYKHYKRVVIGCVVTTVLGAILGAVIALVIK